MCRQRRLLRMKTNLPALLLLGVVPSVHAASLDPGSVQTEAQFRDLYKELVETNTTLSAGDCTLAARAHGRAAARPRDSPTPICTCSPLPDIPRKAGWSPSIRAATARQRPMLLLAHIDVVEAKREDWTRDPFKLVEENGNFYARGALDDKAEAAIWVDTLVRYQAGELQAAAHDQARADLRRGNRRRIQRRASGWRRTSRDLIDAAFALNEGAVGELDAQGNRRRAGSAGRREDSAELPTRGDQPRRPQLAAGEGQRDLSPRRRAEDGSRPTSSRRSSPTRNRAYFTGMAQIQAGKGESDVADAMNALVEIPTTRRRSRWSRQRIRAGTRRCARPASPRCSMAGTRPMRCPSGRAPTSTAVSSRACPPKSVRAEARGDRGRLRR